jgi:hypothetical protein
MGVAPEAMVGVLGGDHRLNNFFDLYSFDLAGTHSTCANSKYDVIHMIIFLQ